jgi:inorganic triphosphatase YgiF
MGREFELKYRADAEKIAAIREKFGGFTSISMETAYYDTFDMKLAFHHWTLRRRMENGVSVCTFKKPMEDGSRAEWEVNCDNIMQGIMLLCQAGAPWELMRATAGGLTQTCGARFTRLAAALELPECSVELALDQGILMGANKQQPFAEVEVELKSGDETAAVAFARSLAEEFGLQEEPRSKFVRAMTLAMQ